MNVTQARKYVEEKYLALLQTEKKVRNQETHPIEGKAYNE